MQLTKLFQEFDDLQSFHGHKDLCSIYGAGCIKNPKLFLLFMNPTARNVASSKNWKGIRAQWLGTKNIWKMLYSLSLISRKLFLQTQKLKPSEWTPDFASSLYLELAKNKVYITNLAKCTQIDARPLHNKIFLEYLELAKKEIAMVNPKHIISFGNQVSSILLGKSIKVSEYKKSDKEILKVRNKKFNVYPTFYPIGQGMRNLPKAIRRIKLISN